MGRWFTARFDGECDECGGFIEAGDEVRYGGDNSLLCAECGEDDDA